MKFGVADLQWQLQHEQHQQHQLLEVTCYIRGPPKVWRFWVEDADTIGNVKAKIQGLAEDCPCSSMIAIAGGQTLYNGLAVQALPLHDGFLRKLWIVRLVSVLAEECFDAAAIAGGA